jgi:(S)-2-hydroxyglutarate dehydrogenase
MTAGGHVAVVGGGILGLAVAHRLVTADPPRQVTLVEKEPRWAAHQTGHNSGVIHSGLYYAPGSWKARLCVAGNRSMFAFAERHGIPAKQTGKLVVATRPDQLPRLDALRDRGRGNGLDVVELDPAQAREIEPEVRCIRALHVASTGVVDFAAVCARLADEAEALGAVLRPATAVRRIVNEAGGVTLETDGADVRADVVVNCAGLHSDRLARSAGARPQVRIVPFRGEYFTLRPQRAGLVAGLVYPVPDPALPFLGVHLTRGIDGSVHAGPNAVLAFAREGYHRRAVSVRDLADMVGYPGLWRLARAQWRTAAGELWRSASRHRFGEAVRELVPAIEDDDLVPAPAGVRAQAVARDGRLVDDFVIERHGRCVHVLNAPSPAATSAFEIARHVVSLLDG